MFRSSNPLSLCKAGAAAACAYLIVLAGPVAGSAAAQTPDYYRLNGETMPLEMQQMMALNGLPPGDYYVDEVGNFGMVGYPPMMNVNGGPPLPGGSGQPVEGGAAPAPDGPAPAAPAAPMASSNDGGLTGTRMFWIFSSVVSSGGSSGYIHLCPGGVYHRSSEGSFIVGGEYNPMGTTPGGMRDGMNDDAVAGAGVSRGTGRWSVQGGALVLQDNDGSTQRFNVSDVQRGTRWRVGQFRYAAERGKASCG
ncbi:MAG: hypothetical protein AAFX03_09130 [Pseudomonadota bacterium]